MHTPGIAHTPDHYAVLGLAAHATGEQIKQAYRQLALQLHPDVNPSAEAQARFQVVQQAYEVLSNPAKRQRFDYLRRHGHKAPVPRPQGTAGFAAGQRQTRPGTTTPPPRRPSWDPARHRRAHVAFARNLITTFYLVFFCLLASAVTGILIVLLFNLFGIHVNSTRGLGAGLLVGVTRSIRLHFWVAQWLLGRYPRLLDGLVRRYHRRYYKVPEWVEYR